MQPGAAMIALAEGAPDRAGGDPGHDLHQASRCAARHRHVRTAARGRRAAQRGRRYRDAVVATTAELQSELERLQRSHQAAIAAGRPPTRRVDARRAPRERRSPALPQLPPAARPRREAAGRAHAARHGRGRRLSERRQVDAREPPARRRRETVVHEQPGVTRDRKELVVEWSGAAVRAHRHRRRRRGPTPAHRSARSPSRRELAIAEADLVLFVVDAHDGSGAGDEELADILRRSREPVILVAQQGSTTRARDDRGASSSTRSASATRSRSRRCTAPAPATCST